MLFIARDVVRLELEELGAEGSAKDESLEDMVLGSEAAVRPTVSVEATPGVRGVDEVSLPLE